MNVLSDVFNNREIASLIWLLLFLSVAFSKSTVRLATHKMLNALFTKKIFISICFMLLYIALLVLGFSAISFWDTSSIKGTIIWTLGAAFILFLNSNKISTDKHFFKDTIKDNIKFMLLLEFIVGLYIFPLIAELILVPVLTLVVMTRIYAGSRPEYRDAEVVLSYVLGILGLVVFSLSVNEIIVDFQGFASDSNLRAFLLVPVFTMSFLPFIYLVALFMEYESVFIRISFFNKDPHVASFAKRKTCLLCHFDLWKLNKWSDEINKIRANTIDEVLSSIQSFKGKG
ncbi:MAG: hypothetical protein GY845_22915 [Planctomycetes bacterium]|nr:hypothetical protein [Planctomycetota bacterium]